jgi:hypothetical protein
MFNREPIRPTVVNPHRRKLEQAHKERQREKLFLAIFLAVCVIGYQTITSGACNV